jgi:hypothetical protein
VKTAGVFFIHKKKSQNEGIPVVKSGTGCEILEDKQKHDRGEKWNRI